MPPFTQLPAFTILVEFENENAIQFYVRFAWLNVELRRPMRDTGVASDA